MKQNRWTCLTTALLSLVAPQAAVWAQALPSVPAVSETSYVPISPQSQPIVTPLQVTELQVEAAIPLAATKPVPTVSKLPIVAPAGTKPAQPDRIARKNVAPNRSDSVPVFDPNARAISPIISVPIDVDTSTPSVTQVAPLPQVSAPASTSSAAITPAATNIPRVNVPASGPIAPRAVAANDRSVEATAPVPVAPAPVSAPQTEGLRSNPDPASFDTGLPQYIFTGDRPQQLVATAIAQVDGEIAAPEPSIAIPVDRPKQATIPSAKSPTTAATVPTVPAIPTATAPQLEPNLPDTDEPAAIDKVIATHRGQASWYGSEAGSKTASGERYNPSGLTAAHRNLPFGTNVRVTNLRTGKTVTVRINDRGPFRRGRIIDLSAGAADAIGLKSTGVGDVKVEVLGIQGYALLQTEE
jgi:rare lipoprotein A